MNRQSPREQVDCYSPYDGRVLLEVAAGSRSLHSSVSAKLAELECTDMGGRKTLGAICSVEAAVEVQKAFDNVDVIAADAGAHYRNFSGASAQFVSRAGEGLSSNFYSNWRSFDDRMDRVAAAVSSSGGACTLESIGKSIEGRDIKAVRLTGSGYRSGGGRVVVGFQQHAREWITGMSGVYAVETACNKAKAEPDWLAGMELVLIPCANPDGAVYSEVGDRMWRKNMRVNRGSKCLGVDMNRNWAGSWGGKEGTSTNPCSDTYIGTSEFSEPETQAQRKIIDEAPTDLHLDVHAYTQLILRPWGYTYEDHPDRAKFDGVGRKMQEALEINGLEYKYGGPEIIYPAAGTAIDYLTTRGGVSFCYEMRPESERQGGFAPSVETILPNAEECFGGIIAGLEWVKDPTATPAPAPPPPCAPYCSGWWNCNFEPECKTCCR